MRMKRTKWGKGWKKRKANVVHGRSRRYHKFKEGGKSITFLTYNGTFGATYKIFAFIQQYNAAFGDEESLKLCNVAMHSTRLACK